MTQEDKELLLKDLCARLPYGVMCRGEYEIDADYNRPFGGYEVIIDKAEGVEHIGFDDGEIYITIGGYQCDLLLVKPYLRPMSSMSRDESFKLEDIMLDFGSFSVMTDVVDFYNAHHLDHYNLIEKGLALKAPEEMYKIK